MHQLIHPIVSVGHFFESGEVKNKKFGKLQNWVGGWKNEKKSYVVAL